MNKPFIALLLATLSFPAAAALLPGNAANGKKLHDAHCQACHSSALYTRMERQVKSVEALIDRVNGCNQQLRKDFSRDAVNDLIRYLNETYYRFE